MPGTKPAPRTRGTLLRATRRRFLGLCAAAMGLARLQRAHAQAQQQGDFYAPGTRTVGSWLINYFGNIAVNATPTDQALVTRSAQVGGQPASARLELDYVATPLRYGNSAVHLTVNTPSVLPVKVLADGRQVTTFPSSPEPPLGHQLTGFFGNDVSGLVPVKNFKIVITDGGTDVTVYEVNLASTDLALNLMSALADRYATLHPQSQNQSNNCFLTTACVELLGLEDDCFELAALRRYRDRVMAATPRGRRALAAYERLAPQILCEMRRRGEEHLLLRLYFTHILPSALAARLGLRRWPMRIYRAMMRRFISRYRPALHARCAQKTEAGMPMRRGAVLVLAAAALLACSAARADEQSLMFATTNIGTTNINTLFMHPWAQAINDEGKGVIAIDVRDGTVIANNANYYDRVMSGVVQISWGLQSTVAGKFPRSDVATLPFMARSSEEGSVALWRLYASGALDEEYGDLHPMILAALTPAGIHMAHPLKSLDNLGGAKLIVASKVNGDAIGLLGGAPLSIPLNEMYESIQRGIADGASVAWTSFNPFKLAEVTNYHVEVRLATSVGMIFMTKKTYDALSPAARAILDRHSGEAQSRLFGRYWDNERRSGKEVTLARGDKRTVVELTPEQATAWRQKLEPLTDDWARATPDGYKILDAYKAQLAKLQNGS